MRSSFLGLFGLCFLVVIACGEGQDGEGWEGDEGGQWRAPDPSCASGERWTGGDEESALMHPGSSCIACHKSQGEGPLFRIAGTVYPAEHEPTDCFGASDAEVVITDANGVSITLSVNAAGNFTHSDTLTFPVHAVVVKGGKTRAMQSEVTDGDCNHCHTDSGEQGAPGRILLP